MNWSDLRVFLAIHRAGTLAGAAKLLKIDQTTVGRRLAALEDDLGVRLFDRTPDGLTITSAGERMVESAGDLDERFGAIEASVRGEDTRAEGVVRIATSENLAVGFLNELLLRVRDAHPGITLEIVTGAGSVNLLRREADIAIRAAPKSLPQQQNLIVRRLGDCGFALYATRAYLDAHPPIAIDRGLEGHDVVLYDDELAPTPPGKWIAETATAARCVVKVNSMLGAAASANASAALALLPCFMTARFPALVRATEGNVLSTDLWLLVHPDLARTARIRAVVEHTVAELEAAKPLLRGAPR